MLTKYVFRNKSFSFEANPFYKWIHPSETGCFAFLMKNNVYFYQCLVDHLARQTIFKVSHVFLFVIT